MAGCFARNHKRILILVIILPLLAVLIPSTPTLAAPVITLSPASGAIGTRVMVGGTNFDSYKGDSISISFDDIEIPNSPLTVPETGSFSIEFNIPDDAEVGRHWVTVTTEADTAVILARSFFIVEEAQIDLDVADGPVGTKATLSGWGFYADRTITFHYYNIIGEKLGTAIASPIGEFSYQFTVPNSIAGSHRITAVNNEGNSAETEFLVIPSTALNLTSSSPGELLTVRGTGFDHKSEVTISFGVYTVASARTDEFGNFEVEFNIPEVKPDTYDVKSLDKHGNLDKVKFITTAGASLNQTTGSVGSRVNVHGNGFAVGETVTIHYDNLRVATDMADNNGAFATYFNVPPSNSGAHVITVSDGTITKKFTFTLESEAPPMPALLLPANRTETRAVAFLDWQNVTDPSQPVIYSLQVASDQNFSSVVLEKTELTESEYTLPEKESLPAINPEAPYYWRVKAIDSANNESEWSAPWSFYVSAPPVPELLQPVSDSDLEMPVFFNWQDVTSLSPPVTYSLQVASDLNFTSIVLEWQGLYDSEYFASEEEELPEVGQDVPYYWRVKATDSANNESDWSTPQSFYIASSFTFPAWLVYTLIGIGVIAIGYIAFRVGRRTASQPPE
jgi:hypothetical protein